MSFRKLSAAFVVVILVVLAAPRSASAATILLDAVVGNVYQSGVQNPCIFSNPPCTVAGFSVALPNQGNVTSYDATATYLGSTLLPYMNGDPLLLGLDIDQAPGQGIQTLTLFEMLINGNVVDTYTGTPHNVPSTNNGTGWADYVLSNFSTFGANDTVSFHFVFNDANPGTENVFVIAGDGPGQQNFPVPEPASMLLLGTGLLAAARAARRRKTS